MSLCVPLSVARSLSAVKRVAVRAPLALTWSHFASSVVMTRLVIQCTVCSSKRWGLARLPTPSRARKTSSVISFSYFRSDSVKIYIYFIIGQVGWYKSTYLARGRSAGLLGVLLLAA